MILENKIQSIYYISYYILNISYNFMWIVYHVFIFKNFQ